jgi:hypothetical protein
VINLWRRFMSYLIWNVKLPNWLAPHIMHMSLPGNVKMKRVK